jgi:hypothetical protein
VRSHAALVCLIVLASIAILPGCSARPTAPSRASSLLPGPNVREPVADSPVHALDRLEWSLEHLDLAEFSTVLSGDFSFRCTPRDSAGNNFDHPALREDLLGIMDHVFETGSALAPRATSIELTWFSDRVALPDPRPGMDPAFHRVIQTGLLLREVTGEGAIDVRDVIAFSFVRGDSVVLPADLVERGVHPDAAAWYIDSMTAQVAPLGAALRPQAARAAPTSSRDWCDWLALYETAP